MNFYSKIVLSFEQLKHGASEHGAKVQPTILTSVVLTRLQSWSFYDNVYSVRHWTYVCQWGLLGNKLRHRDQFDGILFAVDTQQLGFQTCEVNKLPYPSEQRIGMWGIMDFGWRDKVASKDRNSRLNQSNKLLMFKTV